MWLAGRVGNELNERIKDGDWIQFFTVSFIFYYIRPTEKTKSVPFNNLRQPISSK